MPAKQIDTVFGSVRGHICFLFNQNKPHTRIIAGFFILMVFLGVTCTCFSEESTCCLAADSWIRSMDTGEEILSSHIRSQCSFSLKWVEEEKNSDVLSHKRLCNDLVLIWTHKECVYFRDYVSSEAYEPCKSWSREMFEHCLDADKNWFNCSEEDKSD